MLRLDHLTVVAPALAEGVSHVADRLGLEVPFGARHDYMGTHNHRLRLGGGVYLEIVALDPEGADPGRARWFGLNDQAKVRTDWDAGRRLRGWVAATDDLDAVLAAHGAILGEAVPLPPEAPAFAFAIPTDGSLPLDGAAPSLIDHWGRPPPWPRSPSSARGCDRSSSSTPTRLRSRGSTATSPSIARSRSSTASGPATGPGSRRRRGRGS